VRPTARDVRAGYELLAHWSIAIDLMEIAKGVPGILK
jgi:hypothetical protein